MIKVLDKSFAILEEIIAATPQPLGPLMAWIFPL